MEEIDEKEINFESLKNLSIDDLFPKTILYPNQIDIQKKIDEAKTNSSQNNLINSNIPIPSKIFLLDNNTKKISFHKSEKHTLYDILIDDDMIIACGGNYVKIFNYMDILEGNYEARTGFFAENEVFHCLSLTDIAQSNRNVKIIAVGGMNGVIRLINFNDCEEFRQLIGHRNEIYDLKFHPFEKDILLSASKDFSIRMWNIISGYQICIFGGPEGHSAEVLSIDWHLTAEYFVSAGIDCFVKIWKIEDNIKDKIIESRKINKNKDLNNNFEVKEDKKYFKTLIKSNTIYSCNSIHDNYVNCVKFNGNFILTKSIDGIIKEWLPIFNNEGDYYYLVNSYNYILQEKILYMKFSFDNHCKYLSIGNNKGSVFIFELNKCESYDDENFNYYYYVKELAVINSSTEYIIRQTAFHPEMKFIAWINDEGYIFVNDIILK